MSPFAHSSRRGQTLVEALVALSILTTGFIGIATLLTKSFQLNRTTMYDTQGTYLAAEGIELAKNLIDHDVYEYLSGNPRYSWGSCFPHGQGYYYPIDYQTVTCSPSSLKYQSSPPSAARSTLYFNPTTHLFSFDPSGAVATNFTRTIYVANNGNELDVQSTVAWTDGGISNSITLEDHFYNWQP